MRGSECFVVYYVAWLQRLVHAESEDRHLEAYVPTQTIDPLTTLAWVATYLWSRIQRPYCIVMLT